MEEAEQESKHLFNFGKYKGLAIEDVVKTNPAYVRWCVKNVEWFELPEGVVLPPAPRRITYIEDDDYWDDPYDDGWGGEWDW